MVAMKMVLELWYESLDNGIFVCHFFRWCMVEMKMVLELWYESLENGKNHTVLWTRINSGRRATSSIQ
jgi:hypothetical protein